ncbi:hypothetical protein LCGC14_2189460 [marine sediment metagenome]|uniref:Uncharacterized protein n=1 Tax=marine sediment metagenome TaxID=412755 RepID=A0A0F9GFU2_9ZZZZ
MTHSERRYAVRYIRHPRVQRAWGRKTKVHIFCLVFDTPEEARAVYNAKRRGKHRLDSIFFKYTKEPASGISVEDASKGLWRWNREK